MSSQANLAQLIKLERKNQESALANGKLERAIQAAKNIEALEQMASTPTLDPVALATALPLTTVLGLKKFVIKGRGVVAYGVQTSTGFKVLKGSQMVLLESPSGIRNKSSHTKRDQLLTQQLVQEKSNHLEFQEDVEFNSPSLAASVILGSPVSGHQEWKLDGTKKPLSQFIIK